MNRRVAIRTAFVLLSLCFQVMRTSYAQNTGTVDGQFLTALSEDGATLTVTVQLQANPGTRGLGTSTVQFLFDDTVLAFTEGAYSTDYDGQEVSTLGGLAIYTNSSISQPNPDKVSLNIDLISTDGTGAALPATYTDVALLIFMVLDPSQSSTLQWDTRAIFSGGGQQYDLGAFSNAEISFNAAVQAHDDSAFTTSYTPIDINVLTNDSDGLQIIAISNAPSHGQAQVHSNQRLITYTPDIGFSGVDSLRYVASDGQTTAEATVLITVQDSYVNQGPLAQDDEATTPQDTPVEIKVLDNDSDADGDALRVVGFSIAPSQGRAQISAKQQTLTYTPEAGYVGTDSLIYFVSDGRETSEATVRINVTQVNQRPLANADEGQTAEDTSLEIAVLANDTDADGDDLSVTHITSPPQHGSAIILSDGRTVRYEPAANYHGQDTFSYRITDSAGLTAEATVALTITPANDAPTAPTITEPSDGAVLHLEGHPSEQINLAWSPSTDVDGDVVQYRWELAATAGFETMLLSKEPGTASEVSTDVQTLATLIDGLGTTLHDTITLFHRVIATDGTVETFSEVAELSLTRGTLVSNESDGDLPQDFALGGNYPNPFNPTTTIVFDLPASAQVRVTVYDVQGRQVLTLPEQQVAAGAQRKLMLDAAMLPSGVYLYRIVARTATGTHVDTRRMTLLK